MKKIKIPRNILLSIGVLFALAQLLAAGTSDRVRHFLVPQRPATIITFDPPGSTFTLPSAITADGVIIGSYAEASGVTHGFIRNRGGTFTTFDVPSSTSTTPTSITPGGVITGWYSDTIGNSHGFLRALDGSITSFDAPAGSNISALSIFLVVHLPALTQRGTLLERTLTPASWGTASCGPATVP